MYCSLAFLLPLLHLLSICTAASLPMEVVKVKSNVKQLSEQLLVRLKNFQVRFDRYIGGTLLLPKEFPL